MYGYRNILWTGWTYISVSIKRDLRTDGNVDLFSVYNMKAHLPGKRKERKQKKINIFTAEFCVKN